MLKKYGEWVYKFPQLALTCLEVYKLLQIKKK